MSTLKLGCIPKHHPLRVGGLNKCKLLKGKVITTDLKLNTVFKSDNFFFRAFYIWYVTLSIRDFVHLELLNKVSKATFSFTCFSLFS